MISFVPLGGELVRWRFTGDDLHHVGGGGLTNGPLRGN